MQKITRFILLAVFGFSLALNAQTTILDQTLLTQQSFNTFTGVSVAGAQEWNFSSQYGAVCSGFSNNQSNANEDWFISPEMNLSGIGNVTLNFSHARGPAAMINVGVAQGWYKAFATANYTGNPSTTSWVELTGLNQNITSAWQYVSSGDLVIPEAAKSPQTRIAFRYMSSNTQSATWEVKNVKVIGLPQNTAIFKITNWNTEWLGCTQFGPTNESQQLSNVAQAMLLMDSDVYCLQEVINTPSVPTIASLVAQMGSSEWGGAIVPVNTGDCNQRQGIIYKKSRVQLVNSMELTNGNSAQGNSYGFNWSGNRYPALYNVNLIAGSATIPVSLVNIHAKAEDSNPQSYLRRKGGSEGLKGILDGTAYNTKNVIVIGDFNDYLIGTTSNACNCSVSPYKNFMDDTANYTGITRFLTDVGGWGSQPVIEHIIISNELNSNYVANSVMQNVSVAQAIDDFDDTTSNHLPVTATFQFSTLSNPEYTESKWAIYPNPVKEELNLMLPESVSDITAEVYDLTGRRVLSEKPGRNTINVSGLPSGIYILKVGSFTEKFVKE